MAGHNINLTATAHVPNNLIRDIVNDVVSETTFAVIKAIVEKNVFDAGLLTDRTHSNICLGKESYLGHQLSEII